MENCDPEKETRALNNKLWFFLLLWDVDEMIFYMKISTCIPLKPDWSSCKNFVVFQGMRANPLYKHKNFVFKMLFWIFYDHLNRLQKSFWIKWNLFLRCAGWLGRFFLFFFFGVSTMAAFLCGFFFQKNVSVQQVESWNTESEMMFQSSICY